MDTQEGTPSKYAYEVKSSCPKCGRNHVTVFKLRHISDSFFAKLGDFYEYAVHSDPQGLTCTNSAQHPNWGPR